MLLKNEKELTRYVSTVSSKNPKQPKQPMSTQPDNPTNDLSHFQYHLPQIYRSVLKDFRKIIHSFVRLHLIFLLLIGGELLLFLPFSTKLAIAAFALGGIFLTLFSYVVLFFYYQTKKLEQLEHLKEQFLQSCRQHISIPVGEAQHHLSVAEALSKLASYLQDFELSFYQIPTFLQPVSSLLGRLSYLLYRKDVFKMKRFLLQAAVEEHLKQVRITPTDLEVHASLANTYVTLSQLYRDAIPQAGKQIQMFTEGFHSAARLGVEELLILNHYAPNDPWVHEQLAMGYNKLDMPENELIELETLLKLRPQDTEILFRLGILSFHLGRNAKGLQIYQELMQLNFKKAEELIASYGTHK